MRWSEILVGEDWLRCIICSVWAPEALPISARELRRGGDVLSTWQVDALDSSMLVNERRIRSAILRNGSFVCATVGV